jgi:GNAT superfamily N-acetyltransferase
MASTAAWVVEPLNAHHDLSSFDCGERPLNVWLRKYALVNQRNDSSKTRVACHDRDSVIGYHSLAAGSVEHDDRVPPRVRKGLAAYPIPVVVLTRLAVDTRFQGRGLGRALLRDALRAVADISDTVGVRALLVHARTETAREWYLHQAEFESVPGLPFALFLLIKDLRQAAGKT